MNCLNKVRIHDLTIRNRHERSRPKSVQTTNTQAQRKILMIYKISGKLACGLMRQKVNFVAGVCPDHHEQSKVLVVMSWSRPASGPEWPAVIDGTNFVVYHKILKQNLKSWLSSQEHFGYAAGQWPETTGPPLNENKIMCFLCDWWKSRLKSDGAAVVGPLIALKRKSGQSPSTWRKNH